MKQFVAAKLIAGLTAFHSSLKTTPVYTGRTLVNFRWSLGNAVEGTRAAVKSPALPGKTSDLGIGEEPRRAANEDVINAEFAAMIASLRLDPFQKVHLRNNLANYSDIEYGVYAREGKINRTPPGGMTRRGEEQLKFAMGSTLNRVA